MDAPPCGHTTPKYVPGEPFLRGRDCGCCYLWNAEPDHPSVRAWKGLRTVRRADGPGTQLRRLLKALGLTACGRCVEAAAEMDRLGPDGVREEVDRFAARLREQAAKLSWMEYAKVAARAVAAGLILNPLDPYPGLIREACRRAEANPGG